MRHCAFDHLERCRQGQWLAVLVRRADRPDRRAATAMLVRGTLGYGVREVRGFANVDPPPGALRCVTGLALVITEATIQGEMERAVARHHTAAAEATI